MMSSLSNIWAVLSWCLQFVNFNLWGVSKYNLWGGVSRYNMWEVSKYNIWEVNKYNRWGVNKYNLWGVNKYNIWGVNNYSMRGIITPVVSNCSPLCKVARGRLLWWLVCTNNKQLENRIKALETWIYRRIGLSSWKQSDAEILERLGMKTGLMTEIKHRQE